MSNRRNGAGRQAGPEQVDDAEVPQQPDGDAAPADQDPLEPADPVDPDRPDAGTAGEPDSAAAQTTDYTRAGGHVLTDFGWVLEERMR